MHVPPVTPVVCPFCLHQAPLLTGRGARCEDCGTNLVVGERFVLRRVIAKHRGHDVIDGIGLLAKGLDLETREAVLVRIAGTEHAVFERELAVLRGLARRRDVPMVRAQVRGIPHAFVMSWPEGHAVDALLEAGYRVNEAQVAVVVRHLLSLLAELGALSPSVHHRALHAGNVFIADGGRVHLIDFARATDTRHDGVGAVSARPGYALPEGRRSSPAAEDLYAVGVLAVHLLTRVAPDEQATTSSGAPDFRACADVGDAFARFLDRLLASGTRAGFASASDALRALDGAPARATPVMYAAAAGFLALMAAATAGAAVQQLWHSAAPAPPAPLPPMVLQAAPQAELRIETTPSGAELWIDGVQSGTAPLSTVVTLGSHRVEARLARHRSAVQTIDLDARAHSLLLALAPAATTKPAPKHVDEQRYTPRLVPLPEPSPEQLEQARERARLAGLGNELARRIAQQAALRACRPPSDACGDATVQALTLEIQVQGDKVMVNRADQASALAACVQRVIEERVRAPDGADGLLGSVRVTVAPTIQAMSWGWRL